MAWNHGVRLMTGAVPSRVADSSSAADLVQRHVAGLVERRQRARRPAGRLQHVGDHVAVRQLHALAHARSCRRCRPGARGRRRGRSRRRGAGRWGRRRAGRRGRSRRRPRLEAGGEVEDVRRAGDDDRLTGVAGQRRADDGQHLVPGDQRAGAGVGELGGEVGRRQQRVGGGEGRAGQQDRRSRRPGTAGSWAGGRRRRRRGRCRGRPASRRRRAPGAPSSVKVSGTSWCDERRRGRPSGAPPPAGSTRPAPRGTPATAATPAASWRRRMRGRTAWRSCASSRRTIRTTQRGSAHRPCRGTGR